MLRRKTQLLGVLRFLEKYMVYRESVDALDKEVDEFGNRKRPHAWEASAPLTNFMKAACQGPLSEAPL